MFSENVFGNGIASTLASRFLCGIDLVEVQSTG